MKLKEYWDLFKEAWKDSRKRSIIKLGLYIIFFMIVILMIKTSDNNYVVDNNTTKNDYSNYNFNLNFNSNDIINGTYDNNIIKYNYLNQIYYINDNMTYQMINNELLVTDNYSIHISRLLINELDNYLSESEEIYKTEFSDGRIKKGYEIEIEDFAYLYDNKEILDKNKLNISVTYLNDEINEIEYDLTQYFKNYYNIQDNYIIKLSFNNFNNAENLNFNK